MANEMTREDKKVLMQALWGALLAPPWTKDDLITFGKAIFTKKTLKEMDDATFNTVFPFLDKITTDLGGRLGDVVDSSTPAEPAQAAEPNTAVEAQPEQPSQETTEDEPERAVK